MGVYVHDYKTWCMLMMLNGWKTNKYVLVEGEVMRRAESDTAMRGEDFKVHTLGTSASTT